MSDKNKQDRNQQRETYSPEHYNPLNEDYNRKSSDDNYVRDSSPAPTREDRTNDIIKGRRGR